MHAIFSSLGQHLVKGVGCCFVELQKALLTAGKL